MTDETQAIVDAAADAFEESGYTKPNDAYSFLRGVAWCLQHHPDVVALIDRLKVLGQAMPPNAISMEIQRALARFEKGQS